MSQAALVETVFQGTPRVVGSLPADLAEALTTLPFPLTPPPALEDAPAFSGLKWVVHAGYGCLARFWFAGDKDAYDRAVARARVLVLPLEAWRLHRDTAGILTAEEAPTSPKGPAPPSRRVLQDRLAGTGLTAHGLATVAARFCRERRLIIGGMDASARAALFQALFLLVPLETLAATTWCGYAAYLAAEREDVVCLPRVPAAPETGAWPRLKQRLGLGAPKRPLVVDAHTGAVDPPAAADKKTRAAADLFALLLTPDRAADPADAVCHAHVLDCLSQLLHGRAPQPDAPDLPQALRAATQTILHTAR